jgi:NADH:ubiquinone oxidoreductase subunit C
VSEVLLQQVERYASESKAKVTQLRKGETLVEVDQKNLKSFISRIVNDMSIRHLMTITGLDMGQNIGVIYHFTHERDNLHVRTLVPKTDTTAYSIVGIVPGAILYEMEIHDMLGVKFEGNPWMDRKLLLPESWPDDLPPPLLKSSKPEEIRRRLHLEVVKK